MKIDVMDLDVGKVVNLVLGLKAKDNPPTLQYFFEHDWALSIVKHNRDLEFATFSLHDNPYFRHQSRMFCLRTEATANEIEDVIRELIRPIIYGSETKTDKAS